MLSMNKIEEWLDYFEECICLRDFENGEIFLPNLLGFGTSMHNVIRRDK